MTDKLISGKELAALQKENIKKEMNGIGFVPVSVARLVKYVVQACEEEERNLAVV